MRCSNGVRQFLSQAIVNTVPQNNTNKKSYFDWRTGVEYDLAKENLLYFTVTTGHKAGGFNDTAPGAMPNELYNSDYKPESVLAFELGSKNTFFKKDLRVNGSAFLYRYNDMVFQTIAGVGGPPAEMMDENTMQAAPNTAVRQNAPSTTPIYGLDMDVTYRLPLGLEAELHLLLMDAKFADDTVVKDTRISTDAAQNYDVDIGGNWLPRVSAATLNFTLSQLIFTSAGSFDWIITGQTKTQHFMSVYNGNGKALEPVADQPAFTRTQYDILQYPGMAQRLTDVVPAYTRLDVGIGWKHPDGRIAVNAFVNNVTNVAYSTSIISNADLNLRFFNPPRTAGVRMRVEW
jgi:iron complex outermembrane receptor protein